MLLMFCWSTYETYWKITRFAKNMAVKIRMFCTAIIRIFSFMVLHYFVSFCWFQLKVRRNTLVTKFWLTGIAKVFSGFSQFSHSTKCWARLSMLYNTLRPFLQPYICVRNFTDLTENALHSMFILSLNNAYVAFWYANKQNDIITAFWDR